MLSPWFSASGPELTRIVRQSPAPGIRKRNRRHLWALALLVAAWISATAVFAQTQTSTTTSLTVTANGNAVTTVSAGTVVTFTASVHAGATALTKGQVTFCDASAKYCTDVHILGTAQLTSTGTATIKFRPGIGSHSYKAVFLGTNAYAGSVSTSSTLTVTGTPYPVATASAIAETGSWGNYSLTGTVTEAGGTAAPTGSVSFLDTSNGNAVLATQTLGAATASVGWPNPKTMNAIAGGSATELVADLNADGIPDVVVNANPVQIYLGNANGSYTQAATPSFSGPTAGPMVVGDFNGDGIPDLAVAIYGSATIDVLLGNGDGTFQAPILVSLPSTASTTSQILTGDFNRDGIADLAVLDNYDSTITILLGNGDGTFNIAAAPPISGRPSSMAIGDFNGDGKLDLAVQGSGSDNINILLGNGDGTFTAGSSVNAGTAGATNGSVQLVAADFNGDGKLDLAVATGGASGTSESVVLLTGNGDGTFNPPTTPPSTTYSIITWIQVSDFNQDGAPDVVLADSNGNVSVLLNNGSGTFSRSIPVVTGLSIGTLLTVGTGDLNGDGYPDIVAGGYSNGTVGLFLTEPTETATASANITLPAGFHQVDTSYAGDANYTASVSGTIPLWGVPPVTTTSLTLTSGGTAVSSVAPGTTVKLTATVMAGSTPVQAGQVDFCDASAAYCTDVHILGTATLTSNGTATLKFVPGAGTHSYKAVFVQDGYGAASSSNPVSLTVGPAPSPVYTDTTAISYGGSPGDYSLTGTVIGYGGTAPPTGNVSFLDTSFSNTLLATASLGASTPGIGWLISQTPAAGGNLTAEVTGDFNGDGIPDLALLWSSTTGAYSVTILFGTGNGTFTAGPTTVATGVQNSPDMITGDFNGDGKTDLAIMSASAGSTSTEVTVMLSNGDGSFAAPQTTQASTPNPTGGDIVAGQMVAADFNGDGKMDLALVGGLVGSGEVTILLGNGDGTFTSSGKSYGYNSSFSTIATGDFNGDGIPDLVVANYFAPGGALVLLGKGDGTFTAAKTTLPVGTFPSSIQVGDFNQNGKLDLAFGFSNNVDVFLGNGDGTFTQATGSPYTVAGTSLLEGDFNHDGKLDLAGLDTYNEQIDLLLGSGDGTFKPITTTPTVYVASAGNPFAIVSGDFNGDGVPDLAMLSKAYSSSSILLTEPTETATATVSGIAPVGAGTHNVQASYAGDSNYPSSISGTVALTAGLTPLVITPASGTYTSPQTITISESIPGATIYYSAAGTVQTNGYVTYTGPIALKDGGSESIQAYATETGYQSSNIALVNYSLNFPLAPSPTFSVAAGVYSGAQTVSISDSLQGATIYYTTNGSIPTTASTQYTGPITVSSSETIMATAVATGYTMSDPSSAQYLISSSSTPFIYTLAGTGIPGYSGAGGPATFADLNAPQGIAVDSAGDLYISDTANNIIREVAAGTGKITRIAGTVQNYIFGSSYSGDGGPAASANLAGPTGLAIDSAGNLYIADTFNNVVREINASTGIITTFAGNGTAGYAGDGGPATSAELSQPRGLAFDAQGNLYIADSGNQVVRKVAAATGAITTVAGTGTSGYSGDGGPATSAQLNYPYGVAVDSSGNLYIADRNNNAIREVSASTQMISTIAGLGTGAHGDSGDGGPATSAALYYPVGVAVDSAGNVYISDEYNQSIRKIAAGSGIITTIAGNQNSACTEFGDDGGPAASASLCLPSAIKVDSSGDIYFAEIGHHRIRMITPSQAPPTATTAVPTFSVSPGTYSSPQAVTVSDATPGASVYLTLNGSTPSTAQPAYHGPINVSGSVTIKAIAIAPGHLASAVTSAAYTITSTPSSVISTVAGAGAPGALVSGTPALSAYFPTLTSYQSNEGRMAVDGAGDIYFSEPGYNSVWKVSAQSGDIERVAGNGTAGFSGDSGPATSAELNNPMGLAVDSSGNLYIADSWNNRIRKVAAGTGIITTVAGNGNGGTSASSDGDGGPAKSASLDNPEDVAVDSAGNLYIADSVHFTVREVSASTGIITTVAGNKAGLSAASYGDGGPATSAWLDFPTGVAVDSAGNLYIASEIAIRKVTASTGIISTLAGNGIRGYSGDNGSASNAEVAPYAIALDKAGDVFFANYANGVREIPAGTTNVITAVGNGYDLFGGDGGPPAIAGISNTEGIAFDSAGNLYVSDPGHFRIREVTYTTAATPVFTPAPGTYTGTQSVTISDATKNAVVYYTTDGSTPTTSSSVYSGAISVSQSETLKAIAVASGYSQSAVATAAYTIDNPVAPTITVTPSASSITTAQSLTVTVTVSGGSGKPTPTGSVQLSSGSYSTQQTLSSGSASFSIAAGTLPVGSDVLTATYTPDASSTSTYTTATQTSTVTVTAAIGAGVASISVSPSAQTITDAQPANITVTVGGGTGQPTPTGTVTLSSGTYASQQALASGSVSFKIPAGALPSGSNTLNIAYSGDSNYGTATGTATVTVATVVMSAQSPPAVSPGGSASVTVTLNAGSTYSGTMNLACKLTSSPSGAQSLPTCSLNPSSVTLASGGKATTSLTIQTTAGSTTALLQPSDNSLRWLGGGSAALAVVLLFGISTKRRRWMSYFAFVMALLLVSTAAIGCGGSKVSSSSPPPTTPATTAGKYTFTVTATDSSNTNITASTDVSITVQ